MYEWKIIMNNGNQYIIKDNNRNVGDFIHDFFRNDGIRTLSVCELRGKNEDGTNYVIINSQYISEVLFCGGD